MATNGNSSGLPPEAIAFATRMYDAARNGVSRVLPVSTYESSLMNM